METAKIKKGEKTIAGKPPKKPRVELISYSMKMVIPTGNYANIQPEIVVKAGTVEEAHDYIAPHFNKLWKEYYLCSERRPEVKPTTSTSAVTSTADIPMPPANQMPPASSVAFTKASQAINSCLSHKALEIIKKQIETSIKLTPEDKERLQPLIVARIASGQLTE